MVLKQREVRPMTNYSAPEEVLGLRLQDDDFKGADIWAVGVILLEMLTL